jgi:hypothetical protein
MTTRRLDPVATESIDHQGIEGKGTTRQQRGIELFRDMGQAIKWAIDGSFSVPSRTHKKVTYTVTLSDTSETCECPDHIERGSICIHIYAATLRKAQILAQRRAEAAERRRRAEARKQERIVFSPEQVLANLERLGA